MYLLDTNVISELRKSRSVNRGVVEFMARADALEHQCYVSVITIGEIQMGAGKILHRGDVKQSQDLLGWLADIQDKYQDYLLPIDSPIALIWGALRVPNYENSIDKLIAATALSHSLKLVTRNEKDFTKTGVTVVNPFS